VVAEDDVEARIRQRDIFGAGVQQREVNAGLGHQPAGVLQLTGGVVQADGAGPAADKPDRPLGRAAAELEDVLAGDVAERVELVLGNVPDAPAAQVGIQLAAVGCLVLVAVAIPGGTVALRVFGKAHTRLHPITPAQIVAVCRPRQAAAPMCPLPSRGDEVAGHGFGSVRG
jgi:hypothetical protein